MDDFLTVLLTLSIVDFRIVDISCALFTFASDTTIIVDICSVLFVFVIFVIYFDLVVPY